MLLKIRFPRGGGEKSSEQVLRRPLAVHSLVARVDIVEWGLSGRRPSPPLRVGYWPEEAWWVLDKYLLLV